MAPISERKNSVGPGIIVVEAKPQDAKEIAALYNRVYEGKYSLTEFLDPETIEENIQNDLYVWYVAQKDGRVVASAAGALNTYNSSVELGKTVVDKEYGRKGISTELNERVRDSALDRGIQVYWGSCRNDPIYKTAKRLGMTLIGYLPGAHLVAEREIHLLMLGLGHITQERRISSPVRDIYELDTVKRIMKEMKLEDKEEEYPPDTIITVGIRPNVSMRGNYYRPDRSLIVTSLTTRGLIAPEYIQATVLIDKIKQIERARKEGFKITAFLPAWYEKDGKRYDCVLLTKPIVPPVAPCQALETLVDEMSKGFEM